MIRLLMILAVIHITFGLPAKDDSCDCVCGVRGRRNRIIGGRETVANEYPWMVGLYRGGRLYCGGALITSRHVLTAAHCVYYFQKRDIKVILGGHNITSDYTDVRRILAIYKHENFNTSSFDSDVAILKLERPVEFGSKVQPLCLPSASDGDYAGKVGLIAGWGRVQENDETSQILRHTAVPIWTKEKCGESGYGEKRLSDNMMCAGYPEGGIDACQGDSGGPLQHENEAGSLEVIGIVSWGRGCARPNLPGIYTRVANFMPWIENKLAGQCLCQPKKTVRTNFIEKLAEQVHSGELASHIEVRVTSKSIQVLDSID